MQDEIGFRQVKLSSMQLAHILLLSLIFVKYKASIDVAGKHFACANHLFILDQLYSRSKLFMNPPSVLTTSFLSFCH